MGMKDAAKAYKDLVIRRTQEARPSGWQHTEGLLILEYYLYLGRDTDADNVMKLTNDGIAAALGVDDKWFLPRAMHKEWGLRPAQRRVVVEIEALRSPLQPPPP